jgi:hypothetical protein
MKSDTVWANGVLDWISQNHRPAQRTAGTNSPESGGQQVDIVNGSVMAAFSLLAFPGPDGRRVMADRLERLA